MAEELSDVQLVEKVLAAGDKDAFSTLTSRHYNNTYRQACALVNDPIEAQDLVQEAFLSAYTQLYRLQDPTHFAGWLRRIVYTTCMNWHRQVRILFRSLLRLQRCRSVLVSCYWLPNAASPSVGSCPC